MRLDIETKMKLAQTTLQSSRRDSLKIARRFNAGIRLVCASSPAGTAEPARPFRPSRRDLNPFAAQPGVKTPGYSHPSLRDKTTAQKISRGSVKESQRDSGSKPKVARHERPWVNVVRNFSNPNGVVSVGRAQSPQPRWGWGNFYPLTQGSSFLATLGWRTQSRWD